MRCPVPGGPGQEPAPGSKPLHRADAVEMVPAHTVPQLARILRERDRLRSVLEQAPHDVNCMTGANGVYARLQGLPADCNCWKATALDAEDQTPTPDSARRSPEETD